MYLNASIWNMQSIIIVIEQTLFASYGKH